MMQDVLHAGSVCEHVVTHLKAGYLSITSVLFLVRWVIRPA